MLGPLVKVATAGCVCVCTLVPSDVPVKRKPAIHRSAHTKHGVAHHRARAHHRKRRAHRVTHFKKVCSCQLPVEPIEPIWVDGNLPPLTTFVPADLQGGYPELAVPRRFTATSGGPGSIGFGGGGFGGGGGGGFIVPPTETPPTTDVPPTTDIPPVVTPPVITPPVIVPPVGAVPEPATWLMMILGFGLIGAMIRRKPNAGTTFAL